MELVPNLTEREQIAHANLNTIRELQALGKQPAPWLAVQVTVELLLDIIFTTDDERETFGTEVDREIGVRLRDALAQAQQPKLFTP